VSSGLFAGQTIPVGRTVLSRVWVGEPFSRTGHCGAVCPFGPAMFGEEGKITKTKAGSKKRDAWKGQASGQVVGASRASATCRHWRNHRRSKDDWMRKSNGFCATY